MKVYRPNFDAFSREDYANHIISPAKNPEYFNRFHGPMVDALVNRFGSPVKILSLACGYGDELAFFEKDRRVKLTGLDISNEMIAKNRELFPGMEFAVVDVAVEKPKKGAFEGLVAVNATPYCPDKMCGYAFRALRRGGRAAMNFYTVSNEKNTCILSEIQKLGAVMRRISLRVRGKEFPMLEVDNSGRKTITKEVGTQLWFATQKNIEDLLSLIGFKIVLHQSFDVDDGSKIVASTETYILEKPRLWGVF